MKAFVFVNLSKPHYLKTCKKVIAKLKKIEDLALIFSLDDQKHLKVNSDLTIKDADLVLSIGGDGTLLQASKIALAYDIPIVGINAGRAGKLCKFTLKEFINAKENPFKNMQISKRDVLSLQYGKEKYIASNDFVFASRNAGYTIVTNVKTKNHDITYHASGVIISTPTGSTAYNAAANNCLLDPQLSANIITPICACGNEKSTYVVDNKENIVISNKRIDDPTDIYCDGVYVGTLNEDLAIKKYNKKLKLVI